MVMFAPRLLGESSVYPGHPITIAYCIVNKYDSYEEAFKKDPGQGYCNALSDSDIPGAGGNVHAGLDVLRDLRRGLSVRQVVEEADRVWLAYCSGYNDSIEPGRAQARKLTPLLINRHRSWWKK